MTAIFSILLYPVFFLFSYIFAEYIFKAKNAAMIASFAFAAILSTIYYTIRAKISQHNTTQKRQALAKKETVSAIMLLDEKRYKSFFKKGALCDNSALGINEDSLIAFLRKNEPDFLEIYSICGINDGSKNILDFLGIEYIIHEQDEIIDCIDTSVLQKINGNTTKKFNLRNIFTTESARFAIKYGVMLFIFSIFTPYKAYYLIFGGLLIVFALSIFVFNRFSQQNQIPYHRF